MMKDSSTAEIRVILLGGLGVLCGKTVFARNLLN
jgi:hypothetical protein